MRLCSSYDFLFSFIINCPLLLLLLCRGPCVHSVIKRLPSVRRRSAPCGRKDAASDLAAPSGTWIYRRNAHRFRATGRNSREVVRNHTASFCTVLLPLLHELLRLTHQKVGKQTLLNRICCIVKAGDSGCYCVIIIFCSGSSFRRSCFACLSSILGLTLYVLLHGVLSVALFQLRVIQFTVRFLFAVNYVQGRYLHKITKVINFYAELCNFLKLRHWSRNLNKLKHYCFNAHSSHQLMVTA